MRKTKKIFSFFILTILGITILPGLQAQVKAQDATLFTDEFGTLKSGSLRDVVGAEGEYHYVSGFAPTGPWDMTAFQSDPPPQLAWRVERYNDQPVLVQTYQNRGPWVHPMVVGGDVLWRDYTVNVKFAPVEGKGQSGFAFRYEDSRRYYFFGVNGSQAILKMIQNEISYHKLDEKILASQPFTWTPGEELNAQVIVQGSKITASINGNLVLTATDTNYPEGRIALTADYLTRYEAVRVTATQAEKDRFTAARQAVEDQSKAIEDTLPKMVVWKKIKTPGFGTSRNLRFGDLIGDGQMDILFGQVVNHGPKDENNELSCLTAVNLDGKVLWQIGTPDEWKDHVTSDVAFQIYDLEGDGHPDVVYCMNQMLIVADGATGKTKYEIPTPLTPDGPDGHLGDVAGNFGTWNSYSHILGDAIYFADFSGRGRPTDIVLKDRYHHFWVYSDKLKLLWKSECDTGHYPFACDLDGSGRDDLMIGYSLYDHNGNQLWSLDKQMNQHADGVAFANFYPGTATPPMGLMASSDDGMVFVDTHGNILHHYRFGHVQNPVVADFRTDIQGLQTLTINYWGNQGIVHLFDGKGNLIEEFEPCHHGSMCSPVNWSGQLPEYWLLDANVEEGGLYDGYGRRVLHFPNDGHPEMCCAAFNITGDCRDEIVVWDPYELWIYTQSDNPKPGRLYKPKRNPLYNWSNYQASVSLPGWSDDPSK